MIIELSSHDLNVIIPLVRSFRQSLDTIDSYEPFSSDHVILEEKKKYLDSLIEKLYPKY